MPIPYIKSNSKLEEFIGSKIGSTPIGWISLTLWDGTMVIGTPTDDTPDVRIALCEHNEVPPVFPELTPFVDKLLLEEKPFVCHVDGREMGSGAIKWSI